MPSMFHECNKAFKKKKKLTWNALAHPHSALKTIQSNPIQSIAPVATKATCSKVSISNNLSNCCSLCNYLFFLADVFEMIRLKMRRCGLLLIQPLCVDSFSVSVEMSPELKWLVSIFEPISPFSFFFFIVKQLPFFRWKSCWTRRKSKPSMTKANASILNKMATGASCWVASKAERDNCVFSTDCISSQLCTAAVSEGGGEWNKLMSE